MINQFENIMEGDHLDMLEAWTENPEGVELPEEMLRYVKQIEMARDFLYRGDSPQKVAKKLQQHFKELSREQAISRMQDALDYFYTSRELRKDALKEFHYEKQLNLAQAAYLSAKTPADYKIASDIYRKAEEIKGLHLPDEPELPEEFFKKKRKIYSLRPEDVTGLPERVQINQLAKLIDQFNIDEASKLKLKQDAGAEPRQIIDIPHEDVEDEE